MQQFDWKTLDNHKFVDWKVDGKYHTINCLSNIGIMMLSFNTQQQDFESELRRTHNLECPCGKCGTKSRLILN